MNFHNDQSAIVRYSLHSVALGNIHLLRRQKDRVGLENVQFYWMEGLGQYCIYADIAQYGHIQSKKKLGVGDKYHCSIKVHT